MRRNEFLRSAFILAVALSGCRFNKATDGELHPPPDPGDGMDAGGGQDLRPIDVITVLPPDAALFEAEASVNCIEAHPQTKSLPPDVLILLDRSGSMAMDINGNSCTTTGAGGRAGGAGGRGGGGMMTGTGDCGPTSKWTLMTSALKDFLPMVETTVNWGIMYFGSGNTNSSTGDGCDVYSTAQVAPGSMNAGAISTSIDGTKAATSTPTTAAVNAAAKYLAGLDDGNPKFILLATDGLPTCGTGRNGADDDNAIAAVKAAKAMGISTFVIGIGTASGGGDATLTSMATEGGFPRPGMPAYYSVDSATNLKDAFSTITGMVGVCYFSVNPVPKDMSAILDVKGDDKVIPQDGTDGWTFVTMPASSGIQLNGKSCEDYKSGNIKSVVVDLPCIVL
jgi:hypothetical protein